MSERPPPTEADPGSGRAPLPASAALEPPFQSLDPRHVAYQRMAGLVSTAAVAATTLAIGAPVLWFAPLAPPWKVALAVLATLLPVANLIVALSWPALAHRHAGYRVDARGLRIRRGVWWQRRIDVSRSRIQHTDVSQGPLERAHGLATLHVHTAGTEYAHIALAGLAHAEALRVRDQLVGGSEADVI